MYNCKCVYTFNASYNSEFNTNMLYVHIITYGMFYNRCQGYLLCLNLNELFICSPIKYILLVFYLLDTICSEQMQSIYNNTT